MQICLSNLLRTNLPLMWLFPWVELPPSHYVFQRTSMRGDIFISCACLTGGHWAAWCSCLRVTHKHLCALSVPVCIFRHKPLENHFALSHEQCVCPHHSVPWKVFPHRGIYQTLAVISGWNLYQCPVIEVFGEIPMVLWHYFVYGCSSG